MLAVNEPSLYSQILRSRKPVAKEFRRGITREVLPEIRKTGSYQMPETTIQPGKLLQFSRSDLLNLAVEAENECEELSAVVAELAPKVEWVADTSSSFSLGQTPKMLEIPGFGRTT